jgi:hypothetical protein
VVNYLLSLSNTLPMAYVMNDDELYEIEPTVSDFILENGNAIIGTDGYYYHFSEVIKLLKLYKNTFSYDF